MVTYVLTSSVNSIILGKNVNQKEEGGYFVKNDYNERKTLTKIYRFCRHHASLANLILNILVILHIIG